ncbi:Rho GTPase activation protein, partial [Myxozyma melibiosi]
MANTNPNHNNNTSTTSSSRSALRRLRKQSSASTTSSSYNFSEIELRTIVDRILYPTSVEDPVTRTPLFILNSTALPSPRDVSYNLLLPHLLEVVARVDYSIVFFAGGARHRPSWAWMIHTYSALDRDLRKRLKRLYIVHENWWVRTIMEMVAGAVSGKFRKKAVHVPNLSALGEHLDIRYLSIPLAVYMHDRKLEPSISFDSPHSALFAHDLPSGDVVPLFWKECIAHLSVEGLYTEGIFRVPPRTEELDILREAFDRCQQVNLHEYSPHAVASVLKLFLRQLPTPPLPLEIREQLPDFQPSRENTIQAAAMLPLQTVALFSLFIPLLRDIALHERSTRMSVLNLARTITPSLIR